MARSFWLGVCRDAVWVSASATNLAEAAATLKRAFVRTPVTLSQHCGARRGIPTMIPCHE
jgi:hypothetical protein